MNKILITMVTCFFISGAIATEKMSLNYTPQKKTIDLIVGSMIKQSLENIHYTKKKIDDDLSDKAFKEYLEKIDYSKHFLTEDDVTHLKKYSKKMDDELITADFELIDETTKVLNKRLPEVLGYIKELTKNPVEMTSSETLESDPKKRKFVADSKELKNLWSKIIKLEVFSRLVDLKEDRKNQIAGKVLTEKEKKKKKTTSEDLKKKSDLELEKMARDEVLKNFDKYVSRMLKEDHMDKKEKFYNAITRIFDPHTDYMIPDQKSDFDIDMSGKLEGIGALLKEDGQFIKVQEIIIGSASWKTKELSPEDTILKVGQGKLEPVEIVGMPIRDAVKLIRGKKGTEVRLTVKKPNGLMKIIPIIRDTVEIEESYVKSSVLNFEGKKIGYINIPKFYRDFQAKNPRNCTDDTKKELAKLNKENIQGLILDLRNNGGGSLEDARLISGLFIDKGPVVQVRDHQERINVLEDYEEGAEFNKPMVVLVNSFSASASEIVAGALQDYKRAVIIGSEHTHGKGTVQTVIDLKNFMQSPQMSKLELGALKITVQKFYRVNGVSTQYNGISSDVVLPDPLDVLETGEKHLDYSIPSDKISSSKFNFWEGTAFNLKQLSENSGKRVSTNPRFLKIFDRIKLAKSKKDKTVRSLNFVEYEKESEEIKLSYDEDKDAPETKGLAVKVMFGDQSKISKDKQKDFEQALKKDVYLEESMNVLLDLMKV